MDTTIQPPESPNESNPVNLRLPLIPLSPLTQTCIEYAKALAQTTKSLSETAIADASRSDSSSIITSLSKDLCKERENLDRLTKDIQSIQSKSIFDWDTYEIAKEIALINCSLFRLVVLNKSWMANFDKQSNIVPLLDFHRYLSHSFAHQIIYSAVEDGVDSTTVKKRKSATRINDNTNAVAQSIHLANILLHVYRDFSGCTAILTSLQMPEVQRLEKLWSQCSLKIVCTYKELVKLLSPDKDYEAYFHHLWLHTNRFLNGTPLKSRMIAVPFMQAHLTSIRNLIHTHSAVINSNKQNIVLSDAGKKIFLSMIHVLEFCQHLTQIDPTELNRPITLASASRRISSSSNKRSSVSNAGLKLSISACLELDKLHTSAKTYHWIVSRPYLTRAQLHQESLQVEPLAIGEIELESEEEYDLYWDFFSQPLSQTVSETPKKKVVNPASILKEIAKIDTLADVPKNRDSIKSLRQIDDQDVVNELMIVTPDHENNSTSIKNSTDIALTPTHTTIKDLAKNSTDENNPANRQEVKEADKRPEEMETKVKKESLSLIDTIDVKNGDGLDTQVEGSVHAPIASIKPILSPAAPEFVPQQQKYNSSIEDDDDIIIITEEMSYTAESRIPNEENSEEEEEEEEEWTGYPIDNTSSSIIEEAANDNDEDEEEEWTGYPISSQDEDDDDEEVWKGYPAPQPSQQASHSPKTIELSSPSTPQEELNRSSGDTGGHFNNRGYKDYNGKPGNEEHHSKAFYATGTVNKDYPVSWDSNKNQLHAIGKAAARKLQYSISTTDNRKRLPTIFTPSAST